MACALLPKPPRLEMVMVISISTFGSQNSKVFDWSTWAAIHLPLMSSNFISHEVNSFRPIFQHLLAKWKDGKTKRNSGVVVVVVVVVAVLIVTVVPVVIGPRPTIGKS
ncbi:hypothetical protein ElyMa_000007200 [Elysia marginata]|uniref:Uncharacterized protein n=1 Tax=Elysia marginata TaxID=1093978 RepID=A0AAV4EAE3_9GAST|nr:hypothetical protein ElyMa_000007200 [Elysia marginata]